ncbi:MAG: DPP IV N-terminal domain-containing protein, partial [Bacteroidaceae bacterium]|nr:DPP IV N-terminal domain-containing protein [Bacteroidaceae bacterium]
MAQKKQFTLDDLLPGGKTYYQNSVPENKYLTWWGNECVMLEVDRCYVIDKKTGKESKSMFNLDDINAILKNAGKKTVSSLLYTSFPYEDKSYAMVERSNGTKYLVSFADEKKIIWTSEAGKDNEDWNSTSRNLAYTDNHNLYVQDADGKTIQVSKDGNNDIRYGESVHRDEFGIFKGTFWSPKGNLLAFYRMDQSMVSTYPQVNVTPKGTDSRCAQLVPDKYPMAGETSHKVTVGVFDIATKKTIYLDAGDPTDRYFTNVAWAPDEKTIYMIELNRDQTDGELVEYDAKTGKKIRTLFAEHDDKYFEPCAPIQFLPWDSSKFIYLSRRDGYNHIYLYNTDGKLLKQLTKGEWEVFDIIGFNKSAKSVIYSSNEASPIQKNICTVGMNGKHSVIGNATGWHSAKLSNSGEYILDYYSSPTIARNIDVCSTKTLKSSNIFSAKDKWENFNAPKIQLGTIKAADGKTDLYYRLVLPTDFDPNKKYPAVVYVYGGPHAHNIDASIHNGVRG